MDVFLNAALALLGLALGLLGVRGDTWNKDERNLWRRITWQGWGCVILLTAAFGVGAYKESRDAKADRAIQEEKRALQTRLDTATFLLQEIKEVTSKGGDSTLLNELIETKRKMLAQQLQLNGKLSESSIAAIPERARGFVNLKTNEDRITLSRTEEIVRKTEPVVRAILDEFDRRVNILRSMGHDLTTEVADFAIVEKTHVVTIARRA